MFRPAPTPGPLARDFEAYYAAGATWNAGGDPWSRDVWRVERAISGVDARRDEVLPFVGPPATVPLWSLFARLPFPAARAVWLALLGIALAAVVAAALALAGTPLRRSWPAAALAVVSGPVISGVALGQVALIGAAGVALASLAFARRSRWGAPATFVAAFQPNLAFPLAAWLTDRRALVAIAGAACAFLAISVALAGGPAGIVAYVHLLAAHTAAERFSAIQYAPVAVVASFGIAEPAAVAVAAALGVAAVAIVARAAWRNRAQPLSAVCIALAVVPFTATFFHEHDFVVVLIPAIVLAAHADVRVRVATAVASAAVLVDWFGVAQRPATAVETLALACAVACACGLLARRDGESPWIALAPLASTALIAAFAIPLAVAIRAPVWPDALGHFHAPADAAIAVVWAAEQRASGLDALVPAWGILRAIPLAGCALLAGAALRAATGQSEYRSGFQNGVVMTGVAEKPLRSSL